jgi:hypothetical protein
MDIDLATVSSMHDPFSLNKGVEALNEPPKGVGHALSA